jgi:hypothetical protein
VSTTAVSPEVKVVPLQALKLPDSKPSSNNTDELALWYTALRVPSPEIVTVVRFEVGLLTEIRPVVSQWSKP